jgi:hypothetical protein
MTARTGRGWVAACRLAAAGQEPYDSYFYFAEPAWRPVNSITKAGQNRNSPQSQQIQVAPPRPLGWALGIRPTPREAIGPRSLAAFETDPNASAIRRNLLVATAAPPIGHEPSGAVGMWMTVWISQAPLATPANSQPRARFRTPEQGHLRPADSSKGPIRSSHSSTHPLRPPSYLRRSDQEIRSRIGWRKSPF